MKATYFAILFGCLSSSAIADEVVVRSLNLPGASLDQEVTFHPSEAEYNKAKSERLAQLQRNDNSAMVNPSDGPWMIVQTEAKIGMEYKGVGASSGRQHLRQITAAEEALYEYEKSKK